MANQYSPLQSMARFDMATRQNKQKIETILFAENTIKSIVLPKARFLSRIFLQVELTYKATHASKTSFTKSVFDKYNLLKNVKLSVNNGFNPFQISGPMLKLYNDLKFKSVSDTTRNVVDYMTNVVSSGGSTNTVRFFVELSCAINRRDPIALLNLQNGSTQVELSVDFGAITNMMTDTDVTISDISGSVTPITESFSLPAIPEAEPDYRKLKIVREQKENIVGNGDTTIKLPVGQVYRRILVYLASDTAKTPIPDVNIADFQLAFNQADIPYNVTAKYIAFENAQAYGNALPVGVYVFDFADQGVAGLSGGRDYIDTQNLTEFTLKTTFNNLSGNTNYMTIVSETIASLK